MNSYIPTYVEADYGFIEGFKPGTIEGMRDIEGVNGH